MKAYKAFYETFTYASFLDIYFKYIQHKRNTGLDKVTSIVELAQIIKELTDSKSEIVYMPLPIDDPVLRQPDLTRARKILKWEPKVELRDGLKKTIDWFIQNVHT